MTQLTHTEMAAHLRHRIQVAGVKARVRVAPGGGSIQVFTPTFDGEFSAAEQVAIRHIADCNRLTWSRGLPIIVDQMTNPQSFSFYLPVGQRAVA